MKRILFRVFFIIFLAFVLPVAAAHYKNMAETTEKIHIVNNVENNLDVQNSDTKNAKNDEPPASPAKNDGTPSRTITVLIHGDVHEMTLEDYTAGALAAEMPASFPEEALKAQAVAARTFAVYKQSLGTDTQHPNGRDVQRHANRRRVPLGSRQADRSRGQRLGNGYSVSHNRGQRRRRRLSQV